MTKETKVGVVVGLFIVVVASAYFYGNAREEDEFLVSSRDGVPAPSIPLSREKKDAPPPAPDAKYRLPAGTNTNVASLTGADKSATRGTRPADSAVKPANEPQAKTPPVAVNSGGESAAAKSVTLESPPVVTPNRAPNVPAGRDALTWVPPKASGTSGAEGSTGGAPVPGEAPQRGMWPPETSTASNAMPASSLRTSPSDALTRSTLANLEAANAAVPRVGADLGAIGESIRTGREAPMSPPSPAGASNAKPAAANLSGRPALEGGMPRTQPPPVDAWPKQHTIAEYDTLYQLAMDYYDDPAGVDDLVKANPKVNPKNLKLGTVLVIPQRGPKSAGASVASRGTSNPGTPAPAAGSKAPRVEPPAAGTYVVRDGETFYAIARKLYGSPKRSQELFELNKALVKGRPERLKEGMVLRLPAN